MLKPSQLVHQSQPVQALFPSYKPFIHGSSSTSFGLVPVSIPAKKTKLRLGSSSGTVKAMAGETDQKSVKVKAIVSVKPTVGGFFSNLGINSGLDDIQDLLGKSIHLELVSADLDPKTGQEKETIKAYAQRKIFRDEEREVNYEAIFSIRPGFGKIGAVLMENEHRKEMFVVDIIFEGLPGGPLTVHCESWLHSKYDNPQKRVFFTNKTYLPSETPSGLRRLRAEELETLRGNGEGERETFERIYDYDVYNDLSDPTNADLRRPVLGGKDHPYPRRCRTGRPRSNADPSSEVFNRDVYVPRDETFSEVKQLSFSANTLSSGLRALIPSLQTLLVDRKLGFPYFRAIDLLFDEGIRMPNNENQNKGLLRTVLPRLVKAAGDLDDALQFEIPEAMHRDQFFWFKDEEFARQTLAGLNPYSIQLVTEWPLMSKLDPEIYGPQESAITTEMVEKEIRGYMTVKEALEQKKLFMLDYHDLLLPYVSKVRELEGTTLYGSRTLFFLTEKGTLRPLAIELTRPKIGDKPQWREVRTPCYDATGLWLWRLAKAHVLAHDSAFHQLVSHWLRTHCAMEPYIIATNRQLSAMHPIYRLLHPHLRYTMQINALARDALINAGGIIETAFSTAKYSMELCSTVYDKLWRFDHQSLPADLISRGMAVEDPDSPHGVKLTIEDYPFAADGLILWDTLKEWVSDYVSHYYAGPADVEGDKELQAWWTEIRTVGHGDKKDEPWWPRLETPRDLVGILTTVTWVTSAHHAAVNFGQYAYAGYFPNRPTIARTNMPTEDAAPEFWERFMEKPEYALLECFPSQIQATTVMAVLDILSTHSSDEEYIGDMVEPAWRDDPVIAAAFERFNGRLKELEGIIDARNVDQSLKNRCGAGVVPYKLLKPFSGKGITGQGVPYSISI